MKILVAGGTGFIGSVLVPLLKQQHQVTVLGRYFVNQKDTLNWQDLHFVDGYDVVINLAGENIGEKRWSEARKKLILNSRITTTHTLATLCANAKDPKPRLLNASAVGIYGLQAEQPDRLAPAFDENSVINFSSAPDFLAEIGRAWEQAAAPAVKAGCDVTWLRFGVILDVHGGALKKLLPAFKLGFGGIIGSGHQAFSWISRNDVIRAIQFIIEKHITGPVCVVAPGAITQRQFAKALANELHRPCFFPLQSWVVRMLFGQMGDELLLRGQHVKPSRLQQLGFEFHAPTIEQALRQIFESSDEV